MRKIMVGKNAVAVLNVIFWKVGMPHGCTTAEEAARFIIAELEDKDIIGLAWNEKNQAFETAK